MDHPISVIKNINGQLYFTQRNFSPNLYEVDMDFKQLICTDVNLMLKSIFSRK